MKNWKRCIRRRTNNKLISGGFSDETMILFDIVTISQVGRTVRFIRFGAGEDREISY